MLIPQSLRLDFREVISACPTNDHWIVLKLHCIDPSTLTFAALLKLKDRSQPFRKHLLDTIKARFDGAKPI
jgi:hypothetical protein